VDPEGKIPARRRASLRRRAGGAPAAAATRGGGIDGRAIRHRPGGEREDRPVGLGLILLVPEQSTFQVERALLETGGLPGSALKSGALQILLKGGTKE